MKHLTIVATIALTLGACTQPGGSSSSSGSSTGAYSGGSSTGSYQPAGSSTASYSTAAAGQMTVTAKGSFVGDSNHITTGTAKIFRDAQGWKIKLGPDFSLDGAPDPKVALGSSRLGGYQVGTTLGPLTSLTGEQVFALTPGLDIGNYDQVWIWCDQANVPLGHANLTLL